MRTLAPPRSETPNRAIPPMLAAPAAKPPAGPGWAFEYKWDGVRAMATWDGRRLWVHSRRGNDITARYPELAHIGELLGRRTAVLDGEVVALDAAGRPSFQRIQRRIHVADAAAVRRLTRTTPVVYMAFDVLWLDGESTVERPYAERRELLAGLGLSAGAWLTPPHRVGGGGAMLRAAAELGLEGIVAKRLDGVYEPGRRSGSWLKVRLSRRQEFVVGGWTPGTGKRAGTIGALLVGYYDDGDLRYAGKVGTGFKERDLERFGRLFAGRGRASSPFVGATGQRHARYVDPSLVAEVRFTEWTDDGVLRHPSFQGLRDDKDPRSVVRET